MAHILRNFCPSLTLALASTPFVINDVHLAPCSLPRTFDSWSHPGCGKGVCAAEFRNQRALKWVAVSRTPGLGPSPLLSPPSAQLLLWSWVQVPLGPKQGTLMVLEQAYLGSARSLLFLQREAFLQALLTSGEPPRYSLPSVSPHHLPLPPSPATASGTNSSNTSRIVRVPRPLRHAVSCLCAFAHAVSLDWNAFPLLLLPCLPGKHLFITIPLKSPSSRKASPQATSALCKCFSLALVTLYFTCLHVCLPFQTVNPSGHGLYLMHLCISAPSTVPGTQ